MSDDDAIRALRRLRGDDRWADRPFRTAARPAARAVPWRPALAFGLALAAVFGITVLIGQERNHAAVTAAVPWSPLPPSVAGRGIRPLDRAGVGGSEGGTALRGVTAAIEDVPRLPAGGSGGTVGYVVRLTNGTARTVRLSPCPSYTQTLSSADGATVGSSRYRLNCSAAGSIAAGASRSFAMRIAVPATGATGLTWRLDGGAAATKEIP